MKKIFSLIIFFAFFLLVNQANARWYGNTAISYSNNNITGCPSDGNTVGGSNPSYGEAAVTSGNGSLTPIGSRTSVASSGVMYCIKWDASKPTNPTSLTYTIKNSDGTTCNSYAGVNYCKTSTVNIQANWSGAGDQGGSGIKDYDFVVFNSSNGTVINQTFISGNSRNFNITLANGTGYGIKIKTRDNALNLNDNYFNSSTNFFIDTISPTTSDLVNISNTNITNFLANNSLNYSFRVGTNGGAPINLINYRSEKSDNTGYLSQSSSSDTVLFNWDVSKVDNDRGSNGGREYSFLIDRICDAAGNCYNGGYEKKHLVYANTSTITKNVNFSELTSNTNIADGTDKNLTIQLLDNYWNQVVPASGISRQINMKFNGVTNTMYLDQYSRNSSGTKSVDATKANSSTYSSTLFGGGDIVLNNESSTNGNYVYKFRFYTPTANSYNSLDSVSDPDAEFFINNIKMDVTGILGAKGDENIYSSQIKAFAKSLYNTSITGEINENGLRAQTYQNGNISLFKESSSKTPSSGSVKFKFTDYSGKYTLKYGLGNIVSESDTLLTIYKNNISLFNDNISTYLQLDSAPAPSKTDGCFSTHISYSLDGKDILINSDVIGKDSYHGGTQTVDLVQSGLKVVGNIYDKDSQEVFENQEVTSLGTIEKIDIKSDVIAQAYNFAKEVTYNSIADGTRVNGIFGTSGGGKRVGDVIYFGDVDNNGPNKIYELGSGTDINVDATKTILVIGGNLYIRSNMYYSPNKNLGIVVLKDKAGNGGNVYIDPSVTNIVGTIFAEKALISYNGAELDGNVDANKLSNQLHIYGSVFSYNTIGGSSVSTPECPYFETTCGLQKSFKYDLNYLRRYFLTKDLTNTGYFKPAYNAKVSGGGIYNGNGSITGNNANYARIINNTAEDYAKYSVIIEYNPTLKSVIPPFFNQR